MKNFKKVFWICLIAIVVTIIIMLAIYIINNNSTKTSDTAIPSGPKVILANSAEKNKIPNNNTLVENKSTVDNKSVENSIKNTTPPRENKGKKEVIIDDNEEYIANMYYSQSIGIDAGTNYNIYIYNSNNNSYKYRITENHITIAGPTEPVEYETGIIKSVEDLYELNNDFTKEDTYYGQYMQNYYSYKFLDEKLNSFDDLVNKLFE